jgi:hypothetical protein
MQITRAQPAGRTDRLVCKAFMAGQAEMKAVAEKAMAEDPEA